MWAELTTRLRRQCQCSAVKLAVGTAADKAEATALTAPSEHILHGEEQQGGLPVRRYAIVRRTPLAFSLSLSTSTTTVLARRRGWRFTLWHQTSDETSPNAHDKRTDYRVWPGRISGCIRKLADDCISARCAARMVICIPLPAVKGFWLEDVQLLSVETKQSKCCCARAVSHS